MDARTQFDRIESAGVIGIVRGVGGAIVDDESVEAGEYDRLTENAADVLAAVPDGS